MRFPRKSAAMGALVLSSIVLIGCSDTSGPGPDELETTAATPTPEPTFVPDAGAEENKAYFDKTLNDLLAVNEDPSSRELVDALAAAGFDKERMEVTFDDTTVDLEADYMIISVKMPDDMCLIGQDGTRGYSSVVAEPMSTDKCLIGKTQDIDW